MSSLTDDFKPFHSFLELKKMAARNWPIKTLRIVLKKTTLPVNPFSSFKRND